MLEESDLPCLCIFCRQRFESAICILRAAARIEVSVAANHNSPSTISCVSHHVISRHGLSSSSRHQSCLNRSILSPTAAAHDTAWRRTSVKNSSILFRSDHQTLTSRFTTVFHSTPALFALNSVSEQAFGILQHARIGLQLQLDATISIQMVHLDRCFRRNYSYSTLLYTKLSRLWIWCNVSHFDLIEPYWYVCSIVYVSNPNETEHPSTPAWYQRKPWSLASKVRWNYTCGQGSSNKPRLGTYTLPICNFWARLT